MLARVLDLRPGEGRVVLVLFAHLFFMTAAAIVLSAGKNGLFLSAWSAALIPHVIVASAVTTAAVALVFSGLTAALPRRRQIEWTAGVSAASLLLSRQAFLWDPRSSFVLYLWFSILGGILMTLAWGAVGDLLTGRQARRLMPLLVGGTSVAGVAAGFGLAPAVALFGTPNLLIGAALALAASAAVLRLVPMPAAPEPGRAGGLAARMQRGVGLIRSHRLLALLALGVALSAAIGTLVDYQFKAVLQTRYSRDQITSVFGMLAGAVGLGSLVIQGMASRFLFRRWGLVSGAYAQAALIGLGAVWVAGTGWLWALLTLRFFDEAGRFTLGRTVEQVSVAPFPPEVRSAALTVLGGVLKPLATAATGLLLIGLAPILGVRGISWATLAAAAAFWLLFRGHPRLYRAALEDALARHTLQLDSAEGASFVFDRSALEIVDRGLESADTPLRLFAISILRRAPEAEALPRLARLLESPVPEIRAEAASALVEVASGEALPELQEVRRMLAGDPSAEVLRALLEVAHRITPEPTEAVAGHLVHPLESVRRAALVALARCEARFGGERATRVVERQLASEDAGDRLAALEAVAVLGHRRLADRILAAAREPRTRAAAVHAFVAMGGAGERWIGRLVSDPGLGDEDLAPLAGALAAAGRSAELRALLDVAVARQRLGRVVAPVRHARRRGELDAMPPALVRRVLVPAVADGAWSGLVARRLVGAAPDLYLDGLRHDLEGRQQRAAGTILDTLALAYDPAGLERVAPHLRSEDAGRRSTALDLLEGMLEPEDRIPVAAFFEGFEAPERLEEAARVSGARMEALHGDPLSALACSPDPWLRRCAEYVKERVRAPATAAAGAATAAFAPPLPTPAGGIALEPIMLPLMEIVFFLKSSPLFRALPAEELARLARLADTVHLEVGEVLFREGDPGDAFYMVVSGGVGVELGTRRVASHGPAEGIGEMALLDGEPRSATVRATEPTTLLRIDKAGFEAVVDGSTHMAKAIYRELCGRLRAVNRQLHE